MNANARHYPSYLLRMRPADSDGSGRPMLSPEQQTAIAEARERCEDFLRHNRAFRADVFLSNAELPGIVADAQHAGDMRRANAAYVACLEAAIKDEIEDEEEDFDTIENKWRKKTREMPPRVVLPAIEEAAS